MYEVAATARAAGYPSISTAVVQEQLQFVSSRPFPGVEPSMMADALAGKALESEAILGNTIACARRQGVSAPLLEALYYLSNGLTHSFRIDC